MPRPSGFSGLLIGFVVGIAYATLTPAPAGRPGGGGAHHPTSSTAPAHQTTGLRERGNDTSKSTGRSGRQNAAT